jgi:hypothetical protein
MAMNGAMKTGMLASKPAIPARTMDSSAMARKAAMKETISVQQQGIHARTMATGAMVKNSATKRAIAALISTIPIAMPTTAYTATAPSIVTERNAPKQATHAEIMKFSAMEMNTVMKEVISV